MNIRKLLLVLGSTAVLGAMLAVVALAGRGADEPPADITRISQLIGGYGATEAYRFEDLKTLSRAADLVIVASVESAERFNEYGPPEGRIATLEVMLRVSEVASDRQGTGVAPGGLVRLEWWAGTPDVVAGAQAALSGVTAMWFLQSHETIRLRQGRSPEHAAEGANTYSIISSQGLVVNDRGKAVHAMMNRDEFASLVAEVERHSFRDLITSVRQFADARAD